MDEPTGNQPGTYGRRSKSVGRARHTLNKVRPPGVKTMKAIALMFFMSILMGMLILTGLWIPALGLFPVFLILDHFGHLDPLDHKG